MSARTAAPRLPLPGPAEQPVRSATAKALADGHH
ncbi:hypothetical protein SMD44_06981 [Streptomyces alboflavus]|uniref:Uncharacterized protein n=1 Tax=Streptomyces alboflavus TaxID=67267 RepID=A0A1Z1WMA0_9ACTN|nr:hypothetical protein SMD44_06981 [Streptomyces alboflavus]